MNNCQKCKNLTAGLCEECRKKQPISPIVDTFLQESLEKEEKKCEYCENYNCPIHGINAIDKEELTQEPMEWESELKKLLNDKRTGLKDSSDTNKTRYAILDLFSNQIKQAEERHNQDCTREEWARANERQRIYNQLDKTHQVMNEYGECGYNINEIKNLILNKSND